MDKRKFLYYNLYRIENKKRDIFSDYIKTNEIEHSENSNGILLNLSKIDSKHIDFLYDLYNLESQDSYPDLIEPVTKNKNKKHIPKNIEYKNYKLNPLEALILSYSY
jgi:hypothetical protein|tara:strand:+ start:7255 stop:7575 length:321 start_codon:yes stop_codon:yes gene_type:complete